MLTTIFSAIALAISPPAVVVPDPAGIPLGGELQDIDAAALDAMCSVDGGVAGPFGEAEISAPLADEQTWSSPTWKLEPAVGPFTQFERWDGGLILRYEGRTSPEFEQIALAAHIADIGAASGWKEFTNEDITVAELGQRHFTKKAQIDGKPGTLWLHADGGILSTSLYCSYEIDGGTSRVERWKDMADQVSRTPEVQID